MNNEDRHCGICWVLLSESIGATGPSFLTLASVAGDHEKCERSELPNRPSVASIVIRHGRNPEDEDRLSQADDSIPIGDVHVDSLKFTWQEHSVVRDEVARLLKLVHPLL